MKRDDDQLPIEALPDASWNRIERAVYEELDAAQSEHAAGRRFAIPRWALLAFAGVLALQLGAALLFLFVRSEEKGQQQPLGTTRFTSGNEASEAMLGDVAVRLEPNSALTAVDNGGRSSLVLLERGAARFSVPRRGERPAFVVQAGDTRVEVIGTRFRVERVAGSAAVEAYEGKVRVSARDQSAVLTRGMRWPATVAAAAVTAAPVRASEPSTAQAQAQMPAASAQPALAARAQDVEAAPRSDRQRERFEQAATFEASDPERALRLYRVLAQEKGAWGENALYAMARLELELGRHARAQKLLQRYLERHPKGANAADARALLARIPSEERASP
jgi:FecR-like protein/tetratricopeptide repeat protein